MSNSPSVLVSNGTCYSAAGKKLDESFIPCGNDAFGHFACCGAGDNCLADNSCFGFHGQGSGSYLTYMAGCSDPEYRDGSCPDKKGSAQPWVGLTLCDNSNGAWAVCAQKGDPTTLRPGSFCSCTDARSTTIAFSDANTLSSSCSLPKSAGGTIRFFEGHTPTTTAEQSTASKTSAQSSLSPSLTTTPSKTQTQTQTQTSTRSDDSSSSSGNTDSSTSSNSDTQLNTATSSTSSSSPPSSSLASSASSSSAAGSSFSDPSHRSSLSKGAAAGIGVGVGLAALAALLLALILLRRRRQRRGPTDVDNPSDSRLPTTPNVAGAAGTGAAAGISEKGYENQALLRPWSNTNNDTTIYSSELEGSPVLPPPQSIAGPAAWGAAGMAGGGAAAAGPTAKSRTTQEAGSGPSELPANEITRKPVGNDATVPRVLYRGLTSSDHHQAPAVRVRQQQQKQHQQPRVPVSPIEEEDEEPQPPERPGGLRVVGPEGVDVPRSWGEAWRR